MINKLLLTLFVAATSLAASASQPLRRYMNRMTDDGRTVCATRLGTEDFSWWEDTEGVRYSLDMSQNRLVSMSETSFRAALQQSGSGTQKHGPKRSMNASTENGLGAYGVSGAGVVASLGSPVIPVLMVAFLDLDFLPANDVKKIDRFLNEEGYHDEPYAVGSVSDYFRHSSYGAFTPSFEVVGKVKLSKGYKYYAGHNGNSPDTHRAEAVREAVELAIAQGIDFSKYSKSGHAPLISIIHAGPGEQEDYGNDSGDFFWAHFSATNIPANAVTFDSYLLTNETMRDFDKDGNLTAEYMTGIGTFCHEFSHALGLPDMYDVNGITSGEGHTPGYWDVMDYQFMYDGFRPMEYSGYERSLMGWLEVEDLNLGGIEKTYSLKALSSEDVGGTKLYRIVNPNNFKDYLLLENRRKSTFYESNILGSGMLVWHIQYDSSLWASNIVNTTADNQRVHVIPADGAWQNKTEINKRDENNERYTYTGDLFPGYAVVTVFDSRLDNHIADWLVDDVRNISLENDGNITFCYGKIGTSIESGVERHHNIHVSLYDLQGRKINSATSKGIYISENKIIINK